MEYDIFLSRWIADVAMWLNQEMWTFDSISIALFS
jgi:hypothetical protein